jgi:hypothetical protein
VAHVQIRTGPATTNGKIAQIVVDDVDITQHVLAGSVSADLGDPVEGRPASVRLTLLANVLDLDIEDAEIDAQMAAKPRRLFEERTDG